MRLGATPSLCTGLLPDVLRAAEARDSTTMLRPSGVSSARLESCAASAKARSLVPFTG